MQQILDADKLKVHRTASVILIGVLSSSASAFCGRKRLPSSACTKNDNSLLAGTHDARIAVDDNAELEKQLGGKSLAFRLWSAWHVGSNLL